MRILWLINVPLPEASSLLNEKCLPFGGWLVEVSKEISTRGDIELFVLFPYKRASSLIKVKGTKIVYYAFPPIDDRNVHAKNNIKMFDRVIRDVSPDLVHIYGTELSHSLTMIKVCEERKINNVITVQGLVSVISKHMYATLPFKVVFGSTLRNILNRDNVYRMKKSFQRRGKNEIDAIRKTQHIIGRTTWDKVCTSQINPKAKYHSCNETLRNEFYKHKWDINACEKYSLFLSQGQYSIKGLHYVLEAMPIILNRFPKAKVYISGKDITQSSTIKDKLLLTYYGKYIKKMVKKLGIESHVFFTGILDEKQMCERYLKTHVFVCPSSIENSPNSLGEAMILGVPSVASYVGGVPDMLKDKEEGFLYQHDAPYMLAYYVCEIFSNEDLALKTSRNARERALLTHNKNVNIEKLTYIYNDIVLNESLQKRK